VLGGDNDPLCDWEGSCLRIASNESPPIASPGGGVPLPVWIMAGDFMRRDSWGASLGGGGISSTGGVESSFSHSLSLSRALRLGRVRCLSLVSGVGARDPGVGGRSVGDRFPNPNCPAFTKGDWDRKFNPERVDEVAAGLLLPPKFSRAAAEEEARGEGDRSEDAVEGRAETEFEREGELVKPAVPGRGGNLPPIPPS